MSTQILVEKRVSRPFFNKAGCEMAEYELQQLIAVITDDAELDAQQFAF
jgi:hypothetical protein